MRLTRAIGATLMFSMLGGCSIGAHNEPSASPLEISRNPSVLYDKPQQWREMTLNRIRLGDDASVIPPSQIRQRTDAGWIISRDLCRYRDEDGKITGLGVWDYRIIELLAIHSPDEIEMHFGIPEKREEVDRFVIYHYADGHIRVIWNNSEKRVTAINVFM